MVVDNEHIPPKRRRLDPETAIAVDVEQTNATLQHFTGGRRNRWMHGYTEAATANGGTHTTAAHTRLHTNAANSTRPSASARLNSSDAVPSLRQQHNNKPFVFNSHQNQAASPVLVPCEAPPLTATNPSMIALQTPASFAAVSAATGRKSLDLTRAPGPGLPSPAPSDENSNSPILNGAQSVQQRPRSVVQSRNSSLSFGAPPPSASPLAVQQQSLPPRYPMHQQMAYQQPPQVAGPSNLQFVQQRQHSHPRPAGHQRQSMQGSFQTVQSPNMPVQSPTAQQFPVLPSNDAQVRPVVFNASRISQHVLIQRIDMKTAELRQLGNMSPPDHGRLALLREAVEKQDWFYQVVSQLCCLRSVSPALLPRSIRDLAKECYGFVDGLLCPNDQIHPELLNFFAEFPEPIMDIYSDQSQGVRDIFESRVNTVKIFLSRLPPFWDIVVTNCRQLNAPPLVQDLVDTLNMKSSVLQTTAFRAIARMFYGIRESDARGINAVETVHRIDQETYLRHLYRRTEAEKTEAYHMLRHVFEHWTVFQQQEQAKRGASSDFQPPRDVVQYFRRLPGGMQQVQRQQIQVQQAQQRPMAPGQLQQFQHRPVQAQVYAPAGSGSPTNAQSPVNAMPYPPPGHFAAPTGPQGAHQMGCVGSQVQKAHQARPLYHPIHAQPRPQPTNPDTTRTALHQAHLRSPTLQPSAGPDSPQLYRYVVGFSIPPTKLRKDLSQMIKFNVTQALVARLPRIETKVQMVGEPRRRAIGEDSLMFRLRCSSLPAGGFSTESAWVTADNYWPDELTYEFNGKKLELRRKLHHGRYLPVDLTDFIKLGENTLKVFRIHPHNDKRQPAQYALAIEVVGVMSHPTILEKTTRISEEVSLNAIKKSLGGDDAGDDDLAVTSSALSIPLFDPYSGCRIFDIPVRGATCLHRDCFDLETFLSQCKRQQQGWPIVDCWRCPLCRGDVRPQTLVIDEFLVRVREQLAAQGKLDTRAIVVEPDGTWKPKEEERSGVRSPSLEREEQANHNAPEPKSAPSKKAIEIIELDDD